MYTSNYARAKSLPEGLRPVAISVGLPRYWNGDSDKRLAPTWKMMKSPRAVYDREFKKHLQTLDARKLYEQLGDNAVLLCYESHNDWCHRRMVAEWFEEELGIEVPEYGFDRNDTFPYELCNKENKGKLYSDYVRERELFHAELDNEIHGSGTREPESVRQRRESYENPNLSLFDFEV